MRNRNSLSSSDLMFSIINMIGLSIIYQIALFWVFDLSDPRLSGFDIFFEYINLVVFWIYSILAYFFRYNRIVFTDARYQLIYVAFGSLSYVLLGRVESFYVVLLPVVVSVITDSYDRLSRRIKSSHTPPPFFNIPRIALPLWRFYLMIWCILMVVFEFMTFVYPDKAMELLRVDGSDPLAIIIAGVFVTSILYCLMFTAPLFMIGYVLATFNVNMFIISSRTTQIAVTALFVIPFLVVTFFVGNLPNVICYVLPLVFLLLQGVTGRCLKIKSGE